jgi:heterotetrameric sarcosine oxidase gamma subunit
MLQPRPVFGTWGVPTPVREFVASDPNATDTKLLERADIGCILVNSAVDATSVSATLSGAVGFTFPLEAGDAVQPQRYRVFWLTPRSWLVHCPLDEEQQLARRINEIFADKRVHAALFTDYLCWFELSGSQAWNLLAEGSFVSLEPKGLAIGYAKRTLLAGVAVLILHKGPESWVFGVERSRAIYVADWLRAAASRAKRVLAESSLFRLD